MTIRFGEDNDLMPDTVPGDSPAGPMLDLWAKIGVRLESLTAELREQNQRHQRILQAVRQVPLFASMTLSGGAGTIDVPDALSAKTGFVMAIRRLTLAGFTAGAAVTWKNTPGGEVLIPYPAAAANTFGRGEVMLMPGERLTVTASGITGTVTLFGAADYFESWYLPYYIG